MTATHPQAPASPQPEAEAQKARAIRMAADALSHAYVRAVEAEDRMMYRSAGLLLDMLFPATPSAGAPLPEQRQEAAQVEASKDEPMDMALCEIHSVVIRPGQLYTFSRVGDCEKCAQMEREAFDAYGEPTDKPAGRHMLATLPASSCAAAPTPQAVKVPLTEGDVISLTEDLDCDSPGWAIRWATVIQRSAAAAWGIRLKDGA